MLALITSLVCLAILIFGSVINLVIDEMPEMETPLFVGGNIDITV